MLSHRGSTSHKTRHLVLFYSAESSSPPYIYIATIEEIGIEPNANA